MSGTPGTPRSNSPHRLAGRAAVAALAMAAILGLVRATDPGPWIATGMTATLGSLPAPAWQSEPGDTHRDAGGGWLPATDLIVPASLGSSLANGSRLKALDPAGGGRLMELEIVDWMAVAAPQVAGANIDRPVILVVAREIDDGASAKRALLRFVVTLDDGTETASPPRDKAL